MDIVKSTSKEIIKPHALRPGDRVGLVCPGSRPATPAVVSRSQKLIQEMGFNPIVGKHVMSTHGYMAGTDDERLFDLSTFLYDKDIAAIFCLTGGFGSLHLLDKLDFDVLAAAPKLLVGCDDNTALLNAIYARTGIVGLHAPNLDQIKTPYSFETLKKAVTSKKTLPPASALTNNTAELPSFDFYCPVPGTVEGRLVGGNLTAFVSLLGTGYDPHMSGTLLFLEDVDEHIGILDRWFTALYLSGSLQYTNGVVLGAFDNCSPKDAVNMLSIMEIFSDRLQYLSKPSCFGFPFGQRRDTLAIPVGIQARLNCDEGQLEFLEPLFS